MKLELKQDIPFHKKGEKRELEVWANIMQSPNIEVFKRELENGNLEPFFEEVDERITLSIDTDNVFISSDPITDEQLELMEKALNGELLDIDSLDDGDFDEWYANNSVDVQSASGFIIKGITAVLTEYLKKQK